MMWILNEPPAQLLLESAAVGNCVQPSRLTPQGRCGSILGDGHDELN
jgi:hypothetical protein